MDSISLHNHTKFSDGVLTGAAAEKLFGGRAEVWSITDHDNIEYYLSGNKAPLTGIEVTAWLSCQGKGRRIEKPIEFLLYGFDPGALERLWRKFFSEYRKNQELLLNELVKQFRKEGCEVSEGLKLNEHLLASSALYFDLKKYKKNAHTAGDMLNKGVTDFWYSLQTLPVYTPLKDYCKTIDEVRETANELDCRVFLAHPYRYEEDVHELIQELKPMIDGVECLHPSAGENKSRILLELCREHELYSCGGSDLHFSDYEYTPNAHLMREFPEQFSWLDNL
ncbi:MAG: hypothetical protein FWE68_00910 [Defluviitaleaceae bacterium]|nr:hypothetical protein [Defluviitaleaceae bacterium]